MAKKKPESRHTRFVNDVLNQKGVSFDVIETELFGSDLESSQDSTTFEHGYAHYTEGVGAFQLTGKGSKIEHEAVNPAFSLKYMSSSYKAAVAKVGPALFKSDPQKAVEDAAYLAERPKYPYTQTDSSVKLADALSLSQHEIISGAAKGLGVAGPTGGGDVVDTSAQATAARALYNKGKLRGEVLVLALATLGAETKGKYTPQATAHFISSWATSKHHLKLTTGGTDYTNGKYINYVGSSLQTLKAIGDPVNNFTFKGQPGNSTKEQGILGTIGGVVEGEGKGALDAVDSAPKLIEWFSNVDNLIRVGFVVVGVILIIVGVSKLTGASLPNAVPVPVPV